MPWEGDVQVFWFGFGGVEGRKNNVDCTGLPVLYKPKVIDKDDQNHCGENQRRSANKFWGEKDERNSARIEILA